MNKRIVGAAGTVLAAAILAGCDARDSRRRLCRRMRLSPITRRLVLKAGEGIDHPGPVVYDAQHRPAQKVAESDHISTGVRDSVKPLSEVAMDQARTDFPPPGSAAVPPPSTQQAKGITTGQFMWIGSVVEVVNEEPIYADKVLASLERGSAKDRGRSKTPSNISKRRAPKT